MRNVTRSLVLAGGLALAGGAVATPVLADVGFSLNFGAPGYYYAPPPSYYYDRPYYHYYYYSPYY